MIDCSREARSINRAKKVGPRVSAGNRCATSCGVRRSIRSHAMPRGASLVDVSCAGPGETGRLSICYSSSGSGHFRAVDQWNAEPVLCMWVNHLPFIIRGASLEHKYRGRPDWLLFLCVLRARNFPHPRPQFPPTTTVFSPILARNFHLPRAHYEPMSGADAAVRTPETSK